MINDFVYPGINNPFHLCWTPAPLAGSQPRCKIFDLSRVVDFNPLIDYLARDAQAISHISNGLSLIEPEQCLRSPEGRGVMRVVQYVLQRFSLTCIQTEREHLNLLLGEGS
jgi:hypothetical protein